MLSCGANLVALCDPDPAQIEKARADALNSGGEATKAAKAYDDYRKLLDNAASFDAVLIATPDHWHAPLCKAFMKAGKHIYCEKPLTHSVAEARELRELARGGKVVTQMGNQGSASASLRRCTEIIRAGGLGQIREIYHWGIGVTANEGSAQGEDPVPSGFNWDLWVGPSAMRPFKKDVYHPFQLARMVRLRQRRPRRLLLPRHQPADAGIGLGLSRADRPQSEGWEADCRQARAGIPFPARGDLVPLTLYWQGDSQPPAAVIQPLVDVYKDNVPGGIMIVGEKGCIYTSHWNTDEQYIFFFFFFVPVLLFRVVSEQIGNVASRRARSPP